MRLDELFTTDKPMTLGQRLQQAALDILTPLMAHKVPFITVQSVIDQLRATRPGLLVDRGLVMSLLDPDKVPAIQKIEGDRIYLTPPGSGEATKDDEDEAEKNIQKVKDNAIAQAQKEVKKDAPGS